jgi:hypothetical protein
MNRIGKHLLTFSKELQFMNDNYPNPWNFSNADKNLISNDEQYRIEFGELNEIGMGAPIGGQCFLVTNNNDKVLLNQWCGGPVIWETKNNKVALPIWTRKFLKGTVQQIAIADIETRTLTIYSQTFSVLDLREFDGNNLYGYDSPIYNTKTLSLDISRMKVEKIAKF